MPVASSLRDSLNIISRLLTFVNPFFQISLKKLFRDSLSHPRGDMIYYITLLHNCQAEEREEIHRNFGYFIQLQIVIKIRLKFVHNLVLNLR